MTNLKAAQTAYQTAVTDFKTTQAARNAASDAAYAQGVREGLNHDEIDARIEAAARDLGAREAFERRIDAENALITEARLRLDEIWEQTAHGLTLDDVKYLFSTRTLAGRTQLLQILMKLG